MCSHRGKKEDHTWVPLIPHFPPHSTSLSALNFPILPTIFTHCCLTCTGGQSLHHQWALTAWVYSPVLLVSVSTSSIMRWDPGTSILSLVSPSVEHAFHWWRTSNRIGLQVKIRCTDVCFVLRQMNYNFSRNQSPFKKFLPYLVDLFCKLLKVTWKQQVIWRVTRPT